MPIHDWSQVDAGVFHDFHQAWTIEMRNALNGGLLPSGFFAMAEQAVAGPVPDVVTLQRRPHGQDAGATDAAATTIADAPPRARLVTSTQLDPYAPKANRIVVKHRLGEVVAVIEIISPGNKHSIWAFRSFVWKSAKLLRQGVNLLVVDLFPPSPRDPQGIHKAIWDELADEPFELPADKPLIAAAYAAAEPVTAYVEPLAVGDALPSLPIFLDPELYIPAPLEETYQATWSKCPEPVRELVEQRGP